MSFQQGQLNGEQKKFSEQGLIIELENYALGVKDKVQRAWHANGNKRYLKNFTDGHQHGDQWEWASGGWLADYKKYKHGKLLIHKIWRNNKQIYANYTIRDKSFVGKGGEKLCRKVTAGNGTENVLVE